MATQLLSPLDAPWLMIESETNLMHVGALMMFRLPDDAPPDFVHGIVEDMRRHPVAASPFDRQLRRSGIGRLWPRWETLDRVDLDFHLRHAALPWPGGERELAILISQLHSVPLDKSRPLWECHVIEGLSDQRFAMYVKAHHSMLDGVGAMRVMRRTLSEDPTECDMPPFWAYRRPDRPDPPERAPEPAAGDLVSAALGQLGAMARRLPEVARLVPGLGTSVLRMATGEQVGPFQAPDSVLNGRITPQRRVATQSYDLPRLRELARRLGGTLNDVVLAVCAAALRRYLTEIDALPARPLVATIPVNVRPAGGDADTEVAGNAITFGFVSLATDVADPAERVAAIMRSAAQSKEHLGALPRSALTGYTVATMSPLILTQLAGLGGYGPPVFNTTISNVSGPPRRLYLNGAPLTQLHPVSVIFDGQAVNVTVLSYADCLNLTITACPTSLPHVQRLSVYCGEALDELEKAFAGR